MSWLYKGNWTESGGLGEFIFVGKCPRKETVMETETGVCEHKGVICSVNV